LYSGETIFKLSKVSLDKNNTFFLLKLETNTSDYATISLDNIEIYTSNGVSYMKYIGNSLELSSRLKITYQIKEFPNENQVQIHNYI
jgi:hypothetical protein